MSGFFDTIISSIIQIFLSELGDKTFFVCVMNAMKYPKLAVFIGAMIIFLSMTIVTALVGQAVMIYIDPTYIFWVSFGLYLLVSAWMFYRAYARWNVVKVDDELEKSKDVRVSWFKALGKTMLLLFVGEWGDKSQVSTLVLSATSGAYPVILAAMITYVVTALGAVYLGQCLGRCLSERIINLIGGFAFLAFTVFMFIEKFYGSLSE